LLEVESLRDIVVKYQSMISDDLLKNAKEVFEEEEISAGTEEYKVYPTEEKTSGDLSDYLSENVNQDESEEDI